MVMEQLTGLGYGIIALGVMIGIGIVVLYSLGNASGNATANTTIQTIAGYLGTSSGGLASWLPVVIVMVIGLWFLGAFLVRRGRSA